MIGPDHYAEMEARYDAGVERQEEDHRQQVMKWLADMMCRPEEPLVGSFSNSLSHAGVERLSDLIRAGIEKANVERDYHLLCQEERRLRASLTEVRDWINYWSPNFTQDEEWPAAKARMDAALSA